MKVYKTIYVTGAPASGKSSTVGLLKSRVDDLDVWEYGARLTEFLQKGGAQISNQDDLRARSGRVASPSDIDALDDNLLEWTSINRLIQHTIIDSHPVTKEEYGFRVTAFSMERFKKVNPSEIWLFYTAPEITISRIKKNPAGRPSITLEEARIHSAAQVSIACIFGVTVGCPVYMYDTDVNQSNLVDILIDRLSA